MICMYIDSIIFLHHFHLWWLLDPLVLLFKRFAFRKPETHTVHPHDVGNVFDIAKHIDVLFFEPWQNFADPLSHLLLAFFILDSYHKPVDMDHWQLLFFPFRFKNEILEDVQKLDRIDWKVHVDVMKLLEFRI